MNNFTNSSHYESLINSLLYTIICDICWRSNILYLSSSNSWILWIISRIIVKFKFTKLNHRSPNNYWMMDDFHTCISIVIVATAIDIYYICFLWLRYLSKLSCCNLDSSILYLFSLMLNRRILKTISHNLSVAIKLISFSILFIYKSHRF